MNKKQVFNKEIFSSNLYFEYLDLKSPSASKSSSSKHDNETNPFLSAPFHRSPIHKHQTSTTNSSACNLNSIIVGKRTSAFAPYQKPISIGQVPQTESSTTTDVFTNAPFKGKPKRKSSLTTTNSISQQSSTSSNNQSIDLNIYDYTKSNTKQVVTDIAPQQHGYSNLSFNTNIVDEYL